MAAFRRDGTLTVGDNPSSAAETISAHRLDDAETMAEMARTLQATGELIDPHTSIGVAAARQCRHDDAPVIAQAAAHPAKFPDAVKTTELRPQLPPHLSDLHDREERFTVLANDIETIKGFVAISPFRCRMSVGLCA